MSKLTSKDYREKYDELTLGLKSLDAKITSRLYELARNNPNAIPIRVESYFENSKTTTLSTYLLNEVKDLKALPVSTRLDYIELIEKWLEEQNPHKQLKINF